jgi:hypothetical protein
MKKIFKIFIGIGLALLLLILAGIYWGKSWINNNLESVINTDPERKYNFNFDQVEVNLLKQGIVINSVKITPIGDQKGVFVQGEVDEVTLSQVNLLKLIFNKALEIQSLSFFQPRFDVHIPLESSHEERPAEALQGLFGDILSRGKIRNFQVKEANALFLVGEDELGSLHNLHILATELATDSLQLKYPIPFDFQKIYISIDSIDYILGNGQHFKVSEIDFDTNAQQLKMNSLSLIYPNGLEKASSEKEAQVDLIEFKLDSLVLSGIEATSNLYSDLNVRGSKLELNGLLLEDFRNKNLSRPPDEYKPLFQGLLQKINFPLKLDTLKLTNTAIIYGEMVAGKNEKWQFRLDNLNGNFVNISTIPEFQDAYGHLNGKFTGKIKGSGNLDFDLKIPYDRDEFDMNINFISFPLTKINEILKPIMNGEIISGNLAKLNLKIHADSIGSTNQFQFDYDDLKIELFQKGTEKKNKLTSTLANIALNTSNLPSEKRYLTADYTTVRNQYRGPFNLIWKSTKDGIMQIVPGGLAREILNSSEN